MLTREEIFSEIQKLQPWFHCIDLGNGITTKTQSLMGEPVNHPQDLWQTIKNFLPAELEGKSVLDVGCNAGYNSFEVKRSGAARVLGIDGQRQHVRQALFARKILGLDVEFRRLNVYELSAREIGQFDITLALGLIYHLKHLVLALEKLYEVTRELLLVETAILPSQSALASFAQPLEVDEMLLHPLAYVENPAGAKEQVFNWFLPGVGALLALVKNVGFDKAELLEIKNDRAVVVCHKTTTQLRPEVRHHYLASLAIEREPVCCSSGSELTFELKVENSGLAPWSATGTGAEEIGAVHLGAHLLRKNEEEIEWDYGRAELPGDLQPGETVVVAITLRAPDIPGRYMVEFDMVAEHISWFEDYGSGTTRYELLVD